MEEEIKYKNHIIEIVCYQDAENPRTAWDNLSKMICFHKRYNLGDKHETKHGDYNSYAEMEKALIKKFKPVVIKPLYLFDHSGITIKTSPFGDRWDSGQVGFILISKEDALKNFMVKRLTKKQKELCEKILDCEVETYDDFLTGSVYGFRTKDENDEEVDACWGFYGDDHEKSGLLEQAKSNID